MPNAEEGKHEGGSADGLTNLDAHSFVEAADALVVQDPAQALADGHVLVLLLLHPRLYHLVRIWPSMNDSIYQ